MKAFRSGRSCLIRKCNYVVKGYAILHAGKEEERSILFKDSKKENYSTLLRAKVNLFRKGTHQPGVQRLKTGTELAS